MSLLALLACTPAAIVLGDGSGGPVEGADDTGEVIEETPDPHFAAGDYLGVISWVMPDWDWDICRSDLELSVDDEGALWASGTCVYRSDNHQEYDLGIELEGLIDDSGDVEGRIAFETWEYNQGWEISALETELGGVAEDGELLLDFETTAFLGQYGDLPVYGDIEASLD